VEPRDSTDDQRKAMLRAIHEREGRWDEVDPDTEVARIGNEIGLSEDQSYELFGHLVDEGFVEPGRVRETTSSYDASSHQSGARWTASLSMTWSLRFGR
jgi:hypothetical protein